MSSRFDVVVVGAGPAGASAAITAARRGLRVAIIDKARFPRDKCCGDGLTAAALRRLESLGLSPDAVESWQPASRAVVQAPGLRRLELPLSADGLFAVSAQRYHLDAALVDVARRAGVAILEGHAVAGVKSSAGSVEVRSASGMTLSADYVVAADGMWSAVRKLVSSDQPGYRGEWVAGREYLSGTGPLARDLWVFFEPDMLPGYAWSFPLANGLVNVGYGVLRTSAGYAGGLRGQRVDWASRPGIAEVLGPRAVTVGRWSSWPIPARLGHAELSALGGRVLFCGDAAGSCDPMTGEGIAQALDTGVLAAACIATAGPSRPDKAAGSYKRTLRWGMQVDHGMSRLFSKVLARPGGPAKSLSVISWSNWTRSNFARWMFEDYPRAVLATPHRWRPGMLAKPGAYRVTPDAHRTSPVGPRTTPDW